MRMKIVAMVIVLCTSKVFVVNIKYAEKRNVWCQRVKYRYTWTSCKFEGKYKLLPF